MFFEGSEKKVEISIKQGERSLRELGHDYWAQVVNQCGAQILSHIENEKMTAYLLSESSLFVYDRHLIMITCGQTHLMRAVSLMVDKFGADKVDCLIYERKNEIFPDRQPSNFLDDINSLNKIIPGKAFRFGDEDSHHLLMFHQHKPYVASADDVTLEVLMHGVQGSASRFFLDGASRTGDQICEETGVRDIIEGFQVDDHFFEPHGYSLNAIKDDSYYTIHVTPQEIGSYVSFETNYDYNKTRSLASIVDRVIEIFRPNAFDIVFFEPERKSDLVFNKAGYQMRERVDQRLSCGYDVSFMNFFSTERVRQSAFEFDLNAYRK